MCGRRQHGYPDVHVNKEIKRKSGIRIKKRRDSSVTANERGGRKVWTRLV